MSNLVNEYRKRHSLNSISLISEGIAFFESKSGPFICLISSQSRSFSCCEVCEKLSCNLILEIFRFERNMLKMICHNHILPDGDLRDSIVRNKITDFELFIPKNDRDQERWLWYFFTESDIIHRYKQLQALRSSLDKNNTTSFVKEMLWASTNAKELISSYYELVYSILLINRSYLLI